MRRFLPLFVLLACSSQKTKGPQCKIDLRVVFGYKDARPARFVADRYEKLVFLEKVLSPCTKGRLDCGFKIEDTESLDEIYSKTIIGKDGGEKKILLTVVSSSAGADDLANRRDPFQKWQSHFAKETFVRGIRNADIVLYNGHSRVGGGQDFDPPLITKSNHVDYAWYEKNQPGLKLLLEELPNAKQLKVLGLFSCSSNQHFSKAIRKKTTGLRLLTSSRPVYFSDAIQETLDAMSSVLEIQCTDLESSSARSST